MASSYPTYAPHQPASDAHYAALYAAANHPYPPHGTYDDSSASVESESSEGHDKGGGNKEGGFGTLNERGRVAVDVRAVTRTPSPTPSETKELAKSGVFDWEAMMKWRYWVRKEWAWYYVAFAVCLAGVVLFTVYHKTIVHWLRPAADWMHDLPFGWTIPIAVLFVISFPPLFGHEVVAILCGLVWGLGVGFAIVAAGTFIGELGNYYAFKYCCAARGAKLERTRISYACLARVVREGGFKIALIARLSAIPGHFTTAVFSTCGMGVWVFSLAAILSLPKQFITVYLGVALEQSEDGGGSTTDTIIKDVVLGATTLITIGAMWYIYNEMNKVKIHVIYDRRKARQAKMNLAPAPALPYGNPAVLESTTSVSFNPASSETELPLTGRKYGQSDVYAPQPHRPHQPPQPSSDGYPMSERRTNNALPPGAGYAYPAPPSQIPMQRVMSPPRNKKQDANPFSDYNAYVARSQSKSQPRHQPQPHEAQAQGVSYQRRAPPRGYGSPPPDAFSNSGPQYQTPSIPRTPTQSQSRPQQQQQPPPPLPSQGPPVPRLASPPPGPGRASAPQTPTQRAFVPQTPTQGGFKPAPPSAPPLPSTRTRSPPNQSDPFGDSMPNPYADADAYAYDGYAGRGHGHEAEASDATFYTAHGGHSRGGTDVSAFDAGDGASSDAAHGPPSYTTLPR